MNTLANIALASGKRSGRTVQRSGRLLWLFTWNRRTAASVVLLGMLLGMLQPLWDHPIPEPIVPAGAVYNPHDYRQEKVADGVWELKDREPVRQTLAKVAANTNLIENVKAVEVVKTQVKMQSSKSKNTTQKSKVNEVYRWSVKLPSGTVFSFGRQQVEGIEPVVKVMTKDGEFVKYYPREDSRFRIQDSGIDNNHKSSIINHQSSHFVIPQVKGNVISWEIAPGITARYTMQQDRVKADYIVEQKANIKDQKLDFVVEHSEDISPELLPGGDIAWLVKNGNEIFTFPKPVIQEARSMKHESRGIEWAGKYRLTNEQDTSLTLSVVLPKDKLEEANFPLTIDPQVIDSSGVATSTAYGNGRNIIRDGWGNLIVLADGGTSTNSVWYKNYNATTWTDTGTSIFGNTPNGFSIDLDSGGNIHLVNWDASNRMQYMKITLTRTNNAISSISLSTLLQIDAGTLEKRPSMLIANKGMGSGKEKVVISYAMNTTNRGEIRVMQCDVSDNCTTESNWKNVSEEKNGSGGSCNDGTTASNRFPSSGTCKGLADAVLTTATTTTHHATIAQMPGKPRMTPSSALKTSSSGTVYTSLTNALDNNAGTSEDLSNFPSTEYIYVGNSQPFSKVSFQVGNPNVNQGFINGSHEYWNGSTWSTLTNFVDSTGSGFPSTSLNETGSLLFDQPTDWQQNSVDGSSYYWVRLRPFGSMDASVSVIDMYVNDRNSNALVVVGGDDGTDDMRAAYVPWDDVNNDRWENNPSIATAPWRNSSTGASSAISDTGANWTTFTNFPLSGAVDYSNNRLYVGYMSGTTVGSSNIAIKSLPTNRDASIAASWDDVGFPATTEAADTAFSLTADQGDIYLFYVLDPDTNSLVYRRCSPGGGGNGNMCDVAADWGSETSLVAFVSTTWEPSHPQAVVTKAFGDTVGIDVVYTNLIATPKVEYERHYVDMSDKTIVISASTDDGNQADCSSGTDDQFSSAAPMSFGYFSSDSSCSNLSSVYHAGFRFPSLSIAQGATIASAYLDFTTTSNVVVNFTIYGEDIDSSGDFDFFANCTPGSCTDADGDPIISERTRTTNNSSQSMTFNNNRFRFDVTNIVQEIVCRGASNTQPCVGNFNGSGNWASGNALGLLLITDNGTSANTSIVTADSAWAGKPTLHVNLAAAGKNYSLGTATQVASGSASLTDLDHPLSASQVSALTADDDLYASVAATMNYASSSAQPAFLFKVNNSNNSNQYIPTVTAKVKSSISGSSKKIALQAYRGGSTNDWVEVASNNISPSDTEFTLTGTISSSYTDYFFNETPGIGTQYAACTDGTANCWVAYRIIQDLDPTAVSQVLSVDYFDVSFTAGDTTSSTVRGGTTIRGGTTFR